MGPFATTDKDVGPLAGAVPDPIHMDMQSRFNVYRPKDLASGGYCFPIVIWSTVTATSQSRRRPSASSASAATTRR